MNVIHTRAGHLRSGDVHRCHQVNVLAAGRATLTTLHGPRFDREVVTHLRAGDHVVIPPNVPHLYAFEEESVMTESWVAVINRDAVPLRGEILGQFEGASRNAPSAPPSRERMTTSRRLRERSRVTVD